ncbi:RNA-binding ATPase activator esf2 [Lithohypha guttulata]|uniref:RNA-binding ATPase activator esf2 n=1 Tax=Lithohypha guttulata TaxID=1690604 RepID=UPI002DE15A8C|nr:RNA-binding ATPase activator esf2 [Lithohypha guttulata]KAK5103161.1 RNA-binding ATPase activator esf2 [Lithohypha guttulata]
MSRRNEFLDQDHSEESTEESGYDSEAAEVSRTERRGVKRRKLSHSSASSEEGQTDLGEKTLQGENVSDKNAIGDQEVEAASEDDDVQGRETEYPVKSALLAVQKNSKRPKKERTPGVVYLSSLPPYLKPSALRNLLGQRGFEPVTRLFLTPSSKHKHNSKKNSRQLYSEGWIEFESKKTAKRCAEALNAQLVGGRKGGFYYDDLWNMKYLKGMAWDELMAGIREERREEEGRRDEERRKIAAETRLYVEGVEKGKRLEGMKKKRKLKTSHADQADDVQRVWRQHEVAQDRTETSRSSFDPAVQQVLSNIF